MLPARFKVPVLFSYAYLKDRNDILIRECFSNPYTEVLLDCGAFTAKTMGWEVNIDEYIAFINKWKKHLWGYIALDKLGDPVQTDKNLRYMIKAGLKPIPVHVRGDDQKRMDHLFSLSDFVALGGMNNIKGRTRPIEYVKAKMSWARGRKVHWFAYTDITSINTWKPFSVDSSSYSMAARYGKTIIYWDKTQYLYNIIYTDFIKRRDPLVYKLCETYGINPEDLLDKEAWRVTYKLSLRDIYNRDAWEKRKAITPRGLTLYLSYISSLRLTLDLWKANNTRFFNVQWPETMPYLFSAINVVFDLNYQGSGLKIQGVDNEKSDRSIVRWN